MVIFKSEGCIVSWVMLSYLISMGMLLSNFFCNESHWNWSDSHLFSHSYSWFLSVLHSSTTSAIFGVHERQGTVGVLLFPMYPLVKRLQNKSHCIAHTSKCCKIYTIDRRHINNNTVQSAAWIDINRRRSTEIDRALISAYFFGFAVDGGRLPLIFVLIRPD